MIKEEQLAAYKEMAKNASENSMEAQIRANLESTCDKFAGNEDKFDRCMLFLKKVCLEMLGGEDAAEGDENGNYKTLSGDIPDEVCFRICRDYFNDEIWKAEDEENERKKAEKEKNAPAKSAKTKKRTTAKTTNSATEPEPEPEPEKDETEKPVAAVQEEPVTAESLVKKVAERNRLIIEANNKRLGIGLAETIDLFGTGK
jgi:cell division septation protein DedD